MAGLLLGPVNSFLGFWNKKAGPRGQRGTQPSLAFRPLFRLKTFGTKKAGPRGQRETQPSLAFLPLPNGEWSLILLVDFKHKFEGCQDNY